MLVLIAPNPDPGWTGLGAGFHRSILRVKMDPRDSTPDVSSGITSDSVVQMDRHISTPDSTHPMSAFQMHV